MVLAPCVLMVQDGAALRRSCAGAVLSQGSAGRALDRCHRSQGQQKLLGEVKSDVTSRAGRVWVGGSGQQRDNTGARAPPRVLRGVHISVLFCVSQSEVQGFQPVLTECGSFSAPFRSARMETRKALKAGIK